MQVDVRCEFIFPLVQISSRAIVFRVEKRPSDVLTLLHKPLSLKNVSSLPLSVVLDLKKPFLICGVDQQPLPKDAQPIKLEVGEELHLRIRFNPAYKEDLNSRVAEEMLNVWFVEHPHEEQVSVRGEVHFPNLHIQTKALDFGCVLNDTEQVRCVAMTNCSPIPVRYRWSFQTDSQVDTIRFNPSPPKFKPKPPKKERDSLKYSALSRRQSSAGSVEEPTKAPEAVQDPAQESAGSEDSLGAVQAPAQESAGSEDSLGAVQAPAQQPEGSEDSQGAVQAPAQQPEGSEDSQGAVQGPAQESASSEDALRAVQDPAQQSASSEDSLEAKLLPSEPQSLETMQGWRQFLEVEHLALGMEEVFDVQPVSGVLQPGETQQVPFTFFGHANIVARATALCHVEGGPTYEVELRGEASSLSYHLDIHHIDFGLQLFNKVLQAEVTLLNTGIIGFTYKVLNPSAAKADSPLLQEPVVVPSTAYLDPGKEQVLKVHYLPGVLGVFCRTLQIQVGHLAPAEILLKGEGTFLRISLDLPWDIKGNKKFEKILKKIKENMEEDRQSNAADALSEPASVEPSMDGPGLKKQQHLLAPGNKKYEKILKETIEKWEEEMEIDDVLETSEESSEEIYKPGTRDKLLSTSHCLLFPQWDTWVQREMEQVLIEQRVLEQQRIVTSRAPELRGFDKSVRQKLVELELPDYILDMGSVIRGNTETHTVNVTNTGLLPVSFSIDKRVLQGKGFSVDVEQVQCLPYCDTERIEVLFNSTNMPVGELDVSLPIKVTGSYTVHIHLYATVTEDCTQDEKVPDLQLPVTMTCSERRKRRDSQRSPKSACGRNLSNLKQIDASCLTWEGQQFQGKAAIVEKLTADEDPIMGFHQIFLLKNINDAWVCTNDMFRLALHNFG
ncbi:hypothetical protein BTVI_48642 [Pitangus sulphuratus]|nr:hypothetical protein BTVI_48642 [Pitangus sulphuratus]